MILINDQTNAKNCKKTLAISGSIKYNINTNRSKAANGDVNVFR